MKRNIEKELDNVKYMNENFGGSGKFIVLKQSTDAGVWYGSVKMIEGDFNTVKNWCLEHQDDTGFDNDYVSQYYIFYK